MDATANAVQDLKLQLFGKIKTVIHDYFSKLRLLSFLIVDLVGQAYTNLFFLSCIML